jgi:hypothetical protein
MEKMQEEITEQSCRAGEFCQTVKDVMWNLKFQKRLNSQGWSIHVNCVSHVSWANTFNMNASPLELTLYQIYCLHILMSSSSSSMRFPPEWVIL